MAPTDKKVEKTWKCGKCSHVLRQKQSLSCHKRTNCGTPKFSCDDCQSAVQCTAPKQMQKDKRQHKCTKCEKEFNMSGICFVMPAFMKKNNSEKSYTRLNHFHTHLSNCLKQPAKQMKTLKLPQIHMSMITMVTIILQTKKIN